MFDITVLPKTIFILYSSTLKLGGYDLQNVTTSTGRADVIIRVMKSILFSPSGFNNEMGLILFPNPAFLSEIVTHKSWSDWNSKGFLISSKSKIFKEPTFLQASEHTLLEVFYESWLHLGEEAFESLFYSQISEDIYGCVEQLVNSDYSVHLLHEEGKIIQDVDNLDHCCFILGDQLGFTDIDDSRFPDSVKRVSLGNTSYLGSTSISLIRWMKWIKTQNNRDVL